MVFEELGAEVWCMSFEGQMNDWFKRALFIRSNEFLKMNT
jgi:hypothetical protein